jgi:outer membrane biogenesis lipoprotein LolB
MIRSSGAKVFIGRLLSIFAVLLLLCVSGCSSKQQEVVGTWSNTNVTETMEFRADNTGVITAVDQQRLAFTWQDNGSHKYSLDINFPGQKKVLYAMVKDNVLTLENNMGKETYRKKPTP